MLHTSSALVYRVHDSSTCTAARQAERQAERTSLTSGPLPRGDPTAERPLRLSLSWVGGREGQIGEAQMQIMNFSVQRVHERDTYGEGEGSERVTI